MFLLYSVWLVFRTRTVNSCQIPPAFSSDSIFIAFAVGKDEGEKIVFIIEEFLTLCVLVVRVSIVPAPGACLLQLGAPKLNAHCCPCCLQLAAPGW